jgi:hypothetical protein
MKLFARFNWGIEDLATLSGFIRFEALFPKFNAEGRVDACLEFVDWCAGARALVSSKSRAATWVRTASTSAGPRPAGPALWRRVTRAASTSRPGCPAPSWP